MSPEQADEACGKTDTFEAQGWYPADPAQQRYPLS